MVRVLQLEGRVLDKSENRKAATIIQLRKDVSLNENMTAAGIIDSKGKRRD